MKKKKGMPLEIQVARRILTMTRPYFSAAIWALCPVESPGLGSMAVDRYGRLYYDPEIGARFNSQQIAWIIHHEIDHLLRKHSQRCDDSQAFPLRWNVAADCEVNWRLKKEGARFKDEEWITPQTFGFDEGLLAENYYSLLEGNVPDAILIATGESEDEESGPGEGKPKVGHGDCGSCAGGPQREWEQGPPESGSAESETAPGLSEAELECIRQTVANDIRDREKTRRGTVPSDWVSWAEARLSPQVDWRRKLAGLFRGAGRRCGCDDYSYSSPGRRRLPGIVLPRMVSPDLEVAVIVDTSGSMSIDHLNAALSETQCLVRQQGVDEVWLIEVDAKVHEAKRVRDVRGRECKGRGGTDMRVGFEACLKLRPRPQVVVCMTDCETPWPKEFPIRTIICSIERNSYRRGSQKIPSWADLVEVELDG